MKIFAYAGAQIVPIAHPNVCKQFTELKSNLFKVSNKLKNFKITFVDTVLVRWLS